MEDNYIDMVTPSDWIQDDSIIKVIGVGGGGCNAVTYMYNQQIKGCIFIVCNTDPQSLMTSNVPLKLKIGELGAGTDPIEGRKAALEHLEKIEETLFSTKTEILFVTAGMGGGTGTGAAPVIADMAKKKGILTIGVVTIPFENEGNESMSKAIEGIKELEKTVDSLLIINNEKLYECYGNLLAHEAFPKADEILATAIRGITEIIKRPGHINVDLKDVQKMMRDSGMALMGCGTGSGKDRLEEAVKQAMESPLLNDYDLKTSKNVLLNITAGKNEKGLLMDELKEINKLVNTYTGDANNFKRGIVWDDNPEIGDKVNITVIATGFKMNKILGPKENIGNFIMIDESFVYSRDMENSGEIELPEPPDSIKIGYNATANIRKFHFTDENRPVMIVEPGQDRS
ncbi:MAG: cell division protein FtsZ, partial [Clostridium sp.]|nr:cell division protein FtsZ [Clostridium sp.]